MDLNIMYHEDNELKCKICMGYFNDPVICLNNDKTTEIYCENCLIEWNKKNTTSPAMGSKIYEWFKVPEFTKLSLRTRIKTNQNLIKFIEMPQNIFEVMDPDDALHILEMIDAENAGRIQCKDYDNIFILKEIFKNTKMIQSIVQQLIQNQIEWRGTDNWTISHFISRFGNIDLIQYLINQNKDHKKYVPICCNNDKNHTPIDLMFWCGDGNVLNSSDQLKLVEFIADEPQIDLKIGGGSSELIDRLCQSKIESSDLLKAIKILIPKVDMEILLSKNSGKNAVHIICCKSCKLDSADQLEAIKFILDTGMNLSARNNQGWTPLHYMLSSSNNLNSKDQLELLEILVQRKVVDFDSFTMDGWRLIHFICSPSNNFNSSDQLKALQMFVEHKVDLNVRTNNGWRPIHLICSSSNNFNSSDQIQALKFMIEQRVDMDVHTDDDWTPFNLACSNLNHYNSSDQVLAINLIISANPQMDLNIKSGDSHWSPFIMVSSLANHLNSKDQLDVIKMFIENKSMDLNIKQSKGWTAMHYICNGTTNMLPDDLIQCVELLIKEGQRVDWNQVNNDGKKPIHMIFNDTNKMTPIQKLKLVQMLV